MKNRLFDLILLLSTLGLLMAGFSAQKEVQTVKQETKKESADEAKSEKPSAEKSFKITPMDFYISYTKLTGYIGAFDETVNLESGTIVVVDNFNLLGVKGD